MAFDDPFLPHCTLSYFVKGARPNPLILGYSLLAGILMPWAGGVSPVAQSTFFIMNS